MKKYKKFQLIFLLLMILIPITVNAGIICSDGWESSCSIPGPGCCSHHGGVGGNNSNSGMTAQEFYEREEQIEATLWIGGIILFVVFIVGGNWYLKYDEKKQKKLEQEKLDEEKRKKLEAFRQKQKMLLEEQKRKIGTIYNSKENYIKAMVKKLNNGEIHLKMINDGYFKMTSLYEILHNSNLINRLDAYKLLVDICVENNVEIIKSKLLSLNDLTKEELDYYVEKSKNILTVNDLVKYNKINFLDFVNTIEEEVKCSDLIKIYNQSINVYNVLIKKVGSIKYLASDIIEIIGIDSLYNLYIEKGNVFTTKETYEIYTNIISSTNDKNILKFLIKNDMIFKEMLNELELNNSLEYNNVLEYAYINCKPLCFKKLLDIGFNDNIFPLKQEQEQLENILSENYKWKKLKQKENIFDDKLGVAYFIDYDYCYDLFVKYFNELDVKSVIYKGETLIMLAIKHNNYRAIEFLLAEDCNLFRVTNNYTTNGFNPLVYSVYKKHYKITKLLIEWGLNLNYPDIYGNTVLDYACTSTCSKKLELCDLIIQNGGITKDINNLKLIKEAIAKNNKDLLPEIIIPKIEEIKNKDKKD